MYYYVSINNMSNFILTITDSVSKSAEGPIGLYYNNFFVSTPKIIAAHSDPIISANNGS